MKLNLQEEIRKIPLWKGILGELSDSHASQTPKGGERKTVPQKHSKPPCSLRGRLHKVFRDSLSPSHSSEKSHFSQEWVCLSIPAKLSHSLARSSRGKRDLGTDVAIDFRTLQLALLFTYAFRNWRSARNIPVAATGPRERSGVG